METNNYFYGVDFKKLKLYCKLKGVNEYYQIQAKVKRDFDYKKSYEVLFDYREDEQVEIEILTQYDKLERLIINYSSIDFFYFFENMEEQEKVYLNDIYSK